MMQWVRLGLLGLALMPAGACAADPSALWKIVNGACVPHEEATHTPSPCAEVDLAQGVANGFAILKDIKGDTQFLLIPTARISGIEDPAILAPDAPNYWAHAWDARSFVEDRLHKTLPRNAVSLAINSRDGRSQISCTFISTACVKMCATCWRRTWTRSGRCGRRFR